jgi:hypothetical protein
MSKRGVSAISSSEPSAQLLVTSRTALSSSSEVGDSFITSLPSELWYKIATHLFSSALCSDVDLTYDPTSYDIESLLNFLSTARAATKYLRPALCLALIRAERWNSKSQATMLRKLESEFPDLHQEAKERKHQELRMEQLVDWIPSRNRDYFMTLAIHAIELSDSELRELVYTLHIAVLQEELLYGERFENEQDELCSREVDEETLLKDIFFEVTVANEKINLLSWQNSSLNGPRTIKEALLAMPPRLEDEGGEKTKDGEPTAQKTDSEHGEKENVKKADSSASDDETESDLEDFSEERQELARVQTLLRRNNYKLGDSPAPLLLPFVMFPGLRVLRIDDDDLTERAYEAVWDLDDRFKRALYDHALSAGNSGTDSWRKEKAFAYAILAKLDPDAVPLHSPSWDSRLGDSVIYGWHIDFPDTNDDDAMVNFCKKGPYIHNGGDDFSCREKVYYY